MTSGQFPISKAVQHQSRAPAYEERISFHRLADEVILLDLAKRRMPAATIVRVLVRSLALNGLERGPRSGGGATRDPISLARW